MLAGDTLFMYFSVKLSYRVVSDFFCCTYALTQTLQCVVDSMYYSLCSLHPHLAGGSTCYACPTCLSFTDVTAHSPHCGCCSITCSSIDSL